MLNGCAAIIPARAGSKRVPGKNKLSFGGVPAFLIVAKIAKISGVFKQVFISTDDMEISYLAKKNHLSVIDRPSELADDFTPVRSVMQHAIERVDNDINYFALLYPTAVLIQPARLREAFEYISNDTDLDYVIAVKQIEYVFERRLELQTNGLVSMSEPDQIYTRSQDAKQHYADAGLFTMANRDVWLSDKHSLASNTKGIEVGRLEAVDIDTPEDMEFAQWLYARLQSKIA